MSMILCLKKASRDQIKKLTAQPETIEDFLDADTDGYSDLDKAWHGIHYLLTGTVDGGVPPLSYLLIGGETLGDIDVGYGPARVITAEQVSEFAAALDKIDAAAFKSKYDASAMLEHDVYPLIWDEPEDDAFGYLTEHLDLLKAFLKEARQSDSGAVIWIQ